MVAGVLFSLLAAITLNSGNLIQKHAVSSLPEVSARRSGHLIRTLAASREWMLGFVLCLVGVAVEVVAFALAPISVVQSIFNAGVVLLIVVSRLRLGERMQRIEWIGLTIVVASVISISASLGGPAYSAGQAGSGLRVILAAVPTLLVVALVVVAIRAGHGTNGFLYGAAAGLLYGAASLGTKGASTFVVHHGVVHAIPDILTSVYPYVFLFCSALGMLIYQTGLQRFRIAVVGSMSDVVSSTYLVAIGMIVFGEALPKDATTLALRLGGFAGVLVGSVLVAAGGRKGSTETMPPIDSDLGLGEVLVTEVDSLTGHSVDDLVAGTHADRDSGEA
ncbi:MAG: DMT family transporter [Acidimicrobiales bacterium]